MIDEDARRELESMVKAVEEARLATYIAHSNENAARAVLRQKLEDITVKEAKPEMMPPGRLNRIEDAWHDEAASMGQARK